MSRVCVSEGWKLVIMVALSLRQLCCFIGRVSFWLWMLPFSTTARRWASLVANRGHILIDKLHAESIRIAHRWHATPGQRCIGGGKLDYDVPVVHLRLQRPAARSGHFSGQNMF